MDDGEMSNNSWVDLAATKPLPPSSSATDLQPQQESISRPSTAYRVPDDSFQDQSFEYDGGYGDGEYEGHQHYDDPTPSHEPAQEPQTALRPDSIPDLRPPSASHPDPEAQQSTEPQDSSIVEGTDAAPHHDPNDSYTAHMVRRRLQDMESSFITPISPLPTLHSVGFDDTFVFDSPSKLPRGGPPPSSTKLSAPAESPYEDEPSLPALPAPANENAPKEEPDSNHLHVPSNNTSALEGFSSSPTGTTTAQAVSRATSRASHAATEPADISAVSPTNIKTEGTPGRDHSRDDDYFLRAGNNASVRSGSSSLRNSTTANPIPKISLLHAGSTPGNALKSGKRPKYLRNRMSSQRSSSSSFTDEVESDATVGTGGLGADYALQSGGAVPASNMSRNSSTTNIITRQISMGSMASDFREDTTGRIGLEPLEPLDEHEDYSAGDQVKTPRAPKQSLTEPTDTVIARHVRNVQVPESLAREYRTKSGLVTPMRKMSSDVNLGASVSTTRTGRNLTLKEQSSTIERLSKENFDLKLKVMFLSDRLDKLSEEGIKEMISENVELKTSLAVLQRDNKVLRRRVKELEKKLKDEDVRPGTAKSGVSSNDQAAEEDEQHAANEEELIYLRERVDELVTELERVKNENLNKEAEKRRMAEVVKSLQSINESRVGDSLDQDDETEVWKELFNQESGRREQVDEDNQRLSDENKRLRDEVFRLKQDMANSTNNPGGHPSGMHHTTNIYNITRKPRGTSPSRPKSGMSEADTMNGGTSVSVTLVDELRRESEQLRHENAELRREVGAQTSMLTSRNREKERLYQEIEDLKMAQRRGGTASSTLDSILERSASRSGVHDRPASRGSGMTRTATLDEDPEKEELENQVAEFRDKYNASKMQNQDLQQELDAYVQELEAEIEGRKQAEAAALQLQEDLEICQNDIMTLQQERDDLLQENSGMDHEFNNLRVEAQDEIDHLEAEAEQREAEIARLNQELAERSETQEALQEEMRRLSDDMIRFEDTIETQLKRIKQLEDEVAQANSELEDMETKLLAANDKNQRLSVQQESNQGEIAFLREEQEGDKLKIGDLVGQVAQLEVVLREEKDKCKELETQIQLERQQHEMVTNQEKEEVQVVVNQLNRDLAATRDEGRRLRKNLSKQEIEAAEWKERLLELESNLREALGDLNGTRSSFLRDITKLQHDLDTTCKELDNTRASLKEKEHLLKQRDELLETSALESRRLAEMLAKEQGLHRNTKHQFETYQKTQQHVHGSMSSAELRIKELETSKSQDKQRLFKLETSLKDQLNERNSLLLVLWTRLSSLCGTDWAHDNSLINGRALPSLEAVATMLPGFSKNLLAAVKTIESIVGKFQDRVKSVERELWKEYQHLEEGLDKRIKKLDKLESIVRNGVATGSIGVSGAVSQAILEEQRSRFTRLEDAYRQLKVENATLRTANEVRAQTMLDPNLADKQKFDTGGGSPSPSIPTGPRDRDRPSRSTERHDRSRQSSRNHGGPSVTSSSSSTHRRDRDASRPSTMARSRTENEVVPTTTDLLRESYDPGPASAGTATGQITGPFSPGAPSDADIKWMHRLKDLEGKLKAEREGRRLDRSEASRKIVDLEQVALQAQAREARIERRKKMEAVLNTTGGVGSGSGKKSPGPGHGGIGGGSASRSTSAAGN